jgi:vacuolar-type H+-ATPase subunit H
MKVLQEDVEHHADEEDKEIFTEARKLGDDRLEQLGKQIQERKKKLQSEGPRNQKHASEKA